MRTMHLIESAHTGRSTTGMHSFLSISAHVAIVLAALYATTRPAAERASASEPRVYFIPEPRPAAVVPSAPEDRAVTPKPTSPARDMQQVARTPVSVPIDLPAVDAPLPGPSPVAPAEPVEAGRSIGTPVPGANARGGAYGAGEVEVPAAPLSKSGPDYPARALQLALSGAVTASFIVDASGRVERDVQILESTGPEFTAVVRSFLRRARYRPARVGDQPVRQLVEQRFVFELRK